MKKRTKTISLKITYFGQVIYFNGFNIEKYSFDGDVNDIKNLFSPNFFSKNIDQPLMNHYYSLAKSDRNGSFTEFNEHNERQVPQTLIDSAKLALGHYNYCKEALIEEESGGRFIHRDRMKEIMADFSKTNTLDISIMFDGEPLNVKGGEDKEWMPMEFSLRMPFQMEWQDLISDSMRSICDTFIEKMEMYVKNALTSDACIVSKIINMHMTDPPKYDSQGNLLMNANERRLNKICRVPSKTRSYLIMKMKKYGTLDRRDRNTLYSEAKE